MGLARRKGGPEIRPKSMHLAGPHAHHVLVHRHDALLRHRARCATEPLRAPERVRQPNQSTGQAAALPCCISPLVPGHRSPLASLPWRARVCRYSATARALSWALNHFALEGLTFFLLQQGAGRRAHWRALRLAMAWATVRAQCAMRCAVPLRLLAEVPAVCACREAGATAAERCACAREMRMRKRDLSAHGHGAACRARCCAGHVRCLHHAMDHSRGTFSCDHARYPPRGTTHHV